jgi:hypothetical protein
MPLFYFHVRSNGKLTKDTQGREFANLKTACQHAVRETPSLLGDAIRPEKNAYVTTEIHFGGRWHCAIRGTIILDDTISSLTVFGDRKSRQP